MAPPPSIPPPLPPSVEEAYRRKCLQLKRRTNEVQEDNDAARVRLHRLRRGVEKLRLERAFLLDQLAKRTSTNVEDSEGSPSPPPTPQEKPLRSKRGHRKPSAVAALDPNGPSATLSSQGAPNLSPSSDAFSHSVTAGEGGASSQQLKELPEQRSNGVGASSSSKSSKKPSSAFDLYARDNREQATESKAEGVTVEEELARGWKDLPEVKRDEYKAKEKAEAEADAEKEKAATAAAATAATAAKKEEKQKVEKEETERRTADSQAEADDTPARDEDEEMEVDD